MNKILFVIVDHYKSERLGIQILSSIAQEEGFERGLWIINSDSLENGIKRALEFQPRIVAYSGMTYEQSDLQSFNRALKQSGLGFISIFGGHHYTFNPEAILEDKAMDVLCRGEGEEAFRAFIRAVHDGRPYHGIEKLWVRQGDAVIQNPVGALLADLDKVPFPDRDLIPLYDLSADRIHGKSMSVMFSRGCPHGCSYCFNSKYNELFHGAARVRYRSVDNVIREIKELVGKYDLDMVLFYDDSFSFLPKKVIEEFCQKYKREINKPFNAQFRADAIHEDVVAMMKEAGLFHVSIGVECADEAVARAVLRRGAITNEHIVKAFELLHRHGLQTWSLNLLALPVEDPLAVDMKTIEFNMRLKPTWAQFNILLPIPNTPIWDYAIEKGYLRPEAVAGSHKMPSSFIRTQLSYQDPALAAKLSNMHKFASMTVKFPFLLPIVKQLIKLPPNPVYQYVFFFWYGYWKSMGSFKTKFSLRLVLNGIKGIRDYLKKHG